MDTILGKGPAPSPSTAGFFVVLEGTDCSGKQTQTAKLLEALKQRGTNVTTSSFPRYENDESIPVRKFLAGEYGDLSQISPIAASMLYALDRFTSVKRDAFWQEWREGADLLLDRYVTSNITHQASRATNEVEKSAIIDFISFMEYDRAAFGIPQPDLEIFLAMHWETAARLNAHRKNKITGEAEKDILEKDIMLQKVAYEAGLSAATKRGATIIYCMDENGDPKDIEDIHKEVLAAYDSARSEWNHNKT